MSAIKIHLAYEEEYIQPLREMLEDIGHEVVEWDYSLGQFADFSEKKQTDAEIALVDAQAGIMERKEIIELLTRVRKNLPELRLIIVLPEQLKQDETLLSKLLALSIYDMYFMDEYDVNDLEQWIVNPKSYADYNINTNDLKGTVGGKTKIQSIVVESQNRQERRQIVQREYRAFAAKIIVVTGVKGGVGKTDISINLAMAFKNNVKSARVCLLDFDFPYGGVSRALDMCPDCHLGDWLTQSKPLTEQGVKSKVSTFNGLDVIPMAIKIKDGLDFQQRQAEAMLDALRKYYDVIIVDTSNFSEPALSAITISSEVIFVCTHDIVSISATHAYKEDLVRIYGVRSEKMSMFLNMVPANEDISKEKIAELFEDNDDTGVPIIGYAPFDDIVRQHRNKRAIMYEEMPSHPYSKGINMILQSLGLEAKTVTKHNIKDTVDTMKNKIGDVMGAIQKLKKNKEMG